MARRKATTRFYKHGVEVYERLDDLRQALGLSIKQFTALWGITPAAYYTYANGTSAPVISTLYELQKACGVTIEYAYTGATTTLPPKLRHYLRRHLNDQKIYKDPLDIVREVCSSEAASRVKPAGIRGRRPMREREDYAGKS